jgi:hypothetical protein
MKETSCACDSCKRMCKHQPCLGTPKDILKIIAAGHGDKLAMSTWLTGLVVGVHDSPVQMIQPLNTENGCAFLDEEGLCTLHDAGLKPTEGKIAHHSDKPVDDFRDTINYKVAMSWIDENGVNNPLKMLVKEHENL